jgi:hypothetical protein
MSWSLALNRSLTSLDLSWNSICQGGTMLRFGAAMRHNSTLRSLAIPSQCESAIGDDVVRALIDVVRDDNRTLTTLRYRAGAHCSRQVRSELNALLGVNQMRAAALDTLQRRCWLVVRERPRMRAKLEARAAIVCTQLEHWESSFQLD